jgi:hypothetical protein
VCLTKTLKVRPELPIRTVRTIDVRLLATIVLQTTQHGTVTVTNGALVSTTRPNGRLKANNAGTDHVYTGRPNGTLFVHPHFVGVVVGLHHAGVYVDVAGASCFWMAGGGQRTVGGFLSLFGLKMKKNSIKPHFTSSKQHTLTCGLQS